MLDDGKSLVTLHSFQIEIITISENRIQGHCFLLFITLAYTLGSLPIGLSVDRFVGCQILDSLRWWSAA